MKRIMFIGLLCLLTTGALATAAESLAGNWALTRPGEESILWLIRIEAKGFIVTRDDSAVASASGW